MEGSSLKSTVAFVDVLVPSVVGIAIALLGVVLRAHWSPRHNPSRLPVALWLGPRAPLRRKAWMGCAYFLLVWFLFAFGATSVASPLLRETSPYVAFSCLTLVAIAPPNLFTLLRRLPVPRSIDKPLQDLDELTVLVFTDVISSTLGRLLKELQRRVGDETIRRVFQEHLEQAAEYYVERSGQTLDAARSQVAKLKSPMTMLRYLVNHPELGYANLLYFLERPAPGSRQPPGAGQPEPPPLLPSGHPSVAIPDPRVKRSEDGPGH
jgi:hypothetical protein